MDDIKAGDHVTISGVAIDVQNGLILFESPTGLRVWISPEDVKTYRPMHKEGEA